MLEPLATEMAAMLSASIFRISSKREQHVRPTFVAQAAAIQGHGLFDGKTISVDHPAEDSMTSFEMPGQDTGGDRARFLAATQPIRGMANRSPNTRQNFRY